MIEFGIMLFLIFAGYGVLCWGLGCVERAAKK